MSIRCWSKTHQKSNSRNPSHRKLRVIEAEKLRCGFEIMRHGMPDFDEKVNLFITDTKTNPIYASQFSKYYEELQNGLVSNSSILVTHKGQTVMGLIFSKTNNSTTEKSSVNYFGMPAAFLIASGEDFLVLDNAFRLLIQTINELGVPTSNGRFMTPFAILFKPSVLECIKIEKFVFNRSKIQLRFDRVINLNKSLEQIESDYSKSARDAVKKKNLVVEVISNRNSEEIIENEFKSLQELHYLSAGRMTRSRKSWDMQLNMIKNGEAILISGKYGFKTSASSFFMLNRNAAYYAVSAIDKSQKISGATHQLVDAGIKSLPSFGIEELWMGNQFSYLFNETSEKERNIEEFKGYFGGSLVTNLISTGDK